MLINVKYNIRFIWLSSVNLVETQNNLLPESWSFNSKQKDRIITNMKIPKLSRRFDIKTYIARHSSKTLLGI